MADPGRIEGAVRRVRNRKALIHGLLIDALGWDIDDRAWSRACDVEDLARRFSTDYAAAFEKAEKLIAGRKELEGDDPRMFTQALFNRLMFLRFLECKGWLDFGGRTDYLRALYAAGGYRKKSFYNGRLRPLFFAGLSVEGKQRSQAYGRVPYWEGKGVRHLLPARPFGCCAQKVPDPFSGSFSGEGLFRRSALDRQVSDLPDEVFAGILGSGPCNGLFYLYNFTLEEPGPLDLEVAVNPEMLGRVFEELMTGRHAAGAYYTPRTVVSFMCREALKGYLSNRTSATVATVARLVDRQDAGKLKPTHAREILAALDDLKAVDPACGSGAHLLGLLQEMMTLYRLLDGRKKGSGKRGREPFVRSTRRAVPAKGSRPLFPPPVRRGGHSERSEESGPNASAGQILRCAQNDSQRSPSLPAGGPFRRKLRIVSRNLYGMDIDPLATDIASWRLWLSLAADAEEPIGLRNLDFKIATGDALLADWPSRFPEAFADQRGGFDIVLANPPYVNMFSQDAHAPEYRAELRKAFETARGGFDIFVPFMERGIQILRDQGMLAYITPNKLLSAKYAEALRGYLESHAQLRSLVDLSGVPVFGAAVYPVITIAMKKGSGTFCAKHPKGRSGKRFPTPFSARRAGHCWSVLVDPAAGQLAAALEAELTLADVAAISASATVDEAYKWKPAIIDDGRALCRGKPERYVPFIVSGNIRPFHHTWETANVRYLNEVYRRPVIDGKHPAVSPRRYGQMRTPKIIASGMSTRPTCAWVVDPIATGVATVLVIPKDGMDGAYLAAVINSTTMQRLYRVLFGSLSLAGGYLRFGAPQFKLLPVPRAGRAEQRVIARLVADCQDRRAAMPVDVLGEIDERVARLYGVKP